MNNPILFLGIGFPNVWSLIMLCCIILVYIIANVIPALSCPYICIKDGVDILYIPLYFIFCLIPFLGTMFAFTFYEWDNRLNKILIILLYIIIISFIGMLICA